MQILKSKCELFTLWHTRDTKVEPCPVEVPILEVRLTIAGHPYVKLVLLATSAGSRHITRTEIGPNDYFRIRNIDNSALRELIDKLWLLEFDILNVTQLLVLLCLLSWLDRDLLLNHQTILLLYLLLYVFVATDLTLILVFVLLLIIVVLLLLSFLSPYIKIKE